MKDAHQEPMALTLMNPLPSLRTTLLTTPDVPTRTALVFPLCLRGIVWVGLHAVVCVCPTGGLGGSVEGRQILLCFVFLFHACVGIHHGWPEM